MFKVCHYNHLFLVSACFIALHAGRAVVAHGQAGGDPVAHENLKRSRHEELLKFPFSGVGQREFSFHSPFTPSDDTPIANWRQVGSTVVTAVDGLEIVRLTNAQQGLQGVLRNQVRTSSGDFNGYFDVMLGTHPSSAEAADGMGFFFSDENPSVGSAMGIEHTFRGLGIILDTYSNSRKRSVPYMYAYVSEGGKMWNPDSDGADVELTPGCKVLANVLTRVYVQLLDRDLRVATSIEGRVPQPCFSYEKVPMPFDGGGYFAFAGETGHYYGYHDVYSCALLVRNAHQHDVGRENDSGRDHDRVAESSRAPLLTHVPPSVRPAAAHTAFGTGLDRKVQNLYLELAEVIARSGIRDNSQSSVSIRESLSEVSSLTSHCFDEIDRMAMETTEAARLVEDLKETSISLHAYAERFSLSLGTLHDSVHTLRSSYNRLRADQEETHTHVLAHDSTLQRRFASIAEFVAHTPLSSLVFLVVEGLIVAGFVVVARMGAERERARSRRFI